MREGFNWQTVDALPEADSEGRASLWHALIYVDRKEQLEALNLWRVYWSALPFSKNYIAQFAGKCGRVEHSTDGRGLVVYAILPAKLFNVLRNFAIEAVLNNIEPPFKFIVPSTPDEPEYTNPDGSIKYEALATPQYLEWLATAPTQLPWFGSAAVSWASEAVSDAGEWIDDNIIDPVGDGATDGFSYVVSGWDAAVDWTANALDDTWETIQEGLAALVIPFTGQVRVTIDVHIQNRDPLFPPGSDMIRGWGNQPGTRLVPNGVHARIRQWGWHFVPIMGEDQLFSSGQVEIYAAKGQTTRGPSGLCIELENDDGVMTTDFAPNEVCDFGAIAFGGFERNVSVTLNTNQKDLHALTQIVDSAEYSRWVLDYDPHQATVLIGWVANELTGIVNGGANALIHGGEERAMTLCLDFAGLPQASITGLIAAFGSVGGPIGTALGALSASVVLKDMWWPDENDASVGSASRGVMTHEYGHFLMCSLMYNVEGPSAMTPLMDRIDEGQNDSRSDFITLAFETFADAYAMQVVGGADYIESMASRPDGGINFCIASPCMDRNYRAISDYTPGVLPDNYGFYDELARFQSIVFDAFDRADSSARGTLAPWNGDVWSAPMVGGPLVPAPAGYIRNPDEDIVLPGTAWKDWVENWMSESGDDAGVYGLMRGLAVTMTDHGANWCTECDLFALHVNGAPGVTGDPATDRAPDWNTRWQRWNTCRTTSLVSVAIGPAPEQFLNVDAACQVCPNWQWPMNGVCTPCAPNQVARGNACMTCPPNTQPGPNNSCNTIIP